jgi:coatomer subunit beta
MMKLMRLPRFCFAQDLVMDVARVLAAPDLEVRRKTLALALELVSSRNIEELVLVLRKVRSKPVLL